MFYYNLTFLIILLSLSGIFSASETALLSFTSMELEDISSKNIKGSLKYWLKNPNGILSTILILNNVVNILITSATTSMVAENYAGNAVALSTFAVTVAVLIFGEITPKLIAKNYSSALSKIVIAPLNFLSRLMYPLIFILTQVSKLIGKILGLNIVDKEISTVTEKDIRSIISVSGQEGVIDQERKDMLDSVLDFTDLTVSDLVIPRQNVFMLQEDSKIKDVMPEIIEQGYSRIPIYKDSFDTIVGALYVKDLMNVLSEGDKLDQPIKNFMRDLHFVPETKSAFSLLKEFKEKKIHIAVVVDEYGGTVGIITMEDAIEPIVGDIQDEYDKSEVDIKELYDNRYLIKGSLDIDEINERTSLNIPENEEYDSLGGFISFLIGRVPVKNELVTSDDLEIMVKDVDNHAVTYAIVKQLTEVEEDQVED